MTIKQIGKSIEEVRSAARDCISNQDSPKAFRMIVQAERELERAFKELTGQPYTKRPAYKSFKTIGEK